MEKTIYGLLAMAAIAASLPGCSDNIDMQYEPTRTAKRLTAVAVPPRTGTFSDQVLTLAATPSATTVNVSSNTRWSVKVEVEDGWCAASAYSGSGDGSFELRTLENLGDKERRCVVTLNAIDAQGNVISGENGASHAITVIQNYSDVHLSPSDLQPFAAKAPGSKEIQIVANEDIEWTLALSYEDREDSQTAGFMNIAAPSGPAISDLTESGFRGKGNANFTLSLDDNRIAADRVGYITLASGVGTYTIEVRQLGTQFTFDVTTDDYRTIPAQGGIMTFGVYSPLIGWEIQGCPGWIAFAPDKGNADERDRIPVTATIAANPSGTERQAEIFFVPKGENESLYQKYSVRIVQDPNDFTFTADINGGLVGETGGEKVIELDSRFDWELGELPDGVTADRHSGMASGQLQKITVTVGGYQGNTRDIPVRIIPVPTDFTGLNDVNPAEVGVTAREMTITQFGGKDAAVSVPWVTGFTQTEATLEMNYYSPFEEVTAAGIQWKEYVAGDDSEDNWNTIADTDFVKGKSGYATVNVTGLKAATPYVARGYVVVNGRTGYGTVTTPPFTTAGVRPGGDDNPTPNP